MEVYRETRQRVSFLIAAKSMKRKAIGFFAKIISCSTFVRHFPPYRVHHHLTFSKSLLSVLPTMQPRVQGEFDFPQTIHVPYLGRAQSSR
jgi:hypothetical protein